LFGTVNDSGRNIFGAAKKYGEQVFKLPCGAHRMNAVMKDLFKEQEILSEVSARNTVTLFVRKWDVEMEKYDKVQISSEQGQEIQKLNKVIINTCIN